MRTATSTANSGEVPCDAARSHLRSAIRFFCEDRDPVSVHTRASASQEIFRDLLHARGANEASLKDPDDRVKPERRTLWFEDYRLLRDVASLEIEHGGVVWPGLVAVHTRNTHR